MNGANEDTLQCKKNLKWFHTRIESFNNAVPYQIKTLSSFQSNIRKQYRLENLTAVRQERMSAERTIRNLKQLLNDIDGLRNQVKDCDLDKFDRLVSQSRGRISAALRSFDDYYTSLSLGQNNGRHLRISCQTELDSEKEFEDEERQKQTLLQIEESRYVIESQLERAREIEKIERDSQTVNEIFRDLAKIINDQQPTVDHIEDSVEQSHAQVVSAQKELAQVAAKMNGAVYPVLGAVLGTCIGGPVGFLAGLKVGTIMGVTGSVIGFSGGKVLRSRQQKAQRVIMERDADKAAVL